jgi:hypothetical protein
MRHSCWFITAGEQGAAGVPVNVAHIAAVACRRTEQEQPSEMLAKHLRMQLGFRLLGC